MGLSTLLWFWMRPSREAAGAGSSDPKKPAAQSSSVAGDASKSAALVEAAPRLPANGSPQAPPPQAGAPSPLAPGEALPVEKSEPLRETTLKQIDALLAEKAARTPAQIKLDSGLIYLVKQSRGEKIADVPTLQLDVQPDAKGRVEVDITATVSADLLAAITSGGGEVINHFASERAIRAKLPVAAMEPLAARADVQTIRTADHGVTNLGDTVTEGDRTHRADTARSTFNATGAGIKIGVMSNGVDSLATSVANGNLNPVIVLPGQSGSGDEGTAMLEIVQDLVPGAQLYYATANPSTAQFAQNIRDLAAAGCTVIVDDVGYLSESPFQDATVSRAVNDVSAAGVMYFSAAGNSGGVDKGTAGTWEGDFADGGATTLGSKAASVHSFGSGYTYNTVISGGSQRRVDLFWADPLGASNNDYDFFVVDTTGAVLRSATTTQNGTQDPYETTGTLNVGERIVIVKSATAAARFMHLDTGRGVLSIVTPGNVRGHNAAVAANAFSVAASSVVHSPSPAVFTGGATNPAESFSSDGPRRMFFNSDGTAITPGDFSSTGGQVYQKPDITAADAVSTSVPGFTSFSGTSAAAPHAAAIAALIKSSYPALTPAQIRDVMAATALDIEGPGFDRDTGSGIIMAYEAMVAVATPSITGFSPGSGLPAAAVVITGTSFSIATSVAFNGLSATFSIDSPTQITATIPAGVTSGPITVVTPFGTATSAASFTLFGFSPVLGPPGTSVILTGTGFTGASGVTFSGASASFTVNSDTQITAMVPVGASTGPISVTTPGEVITSSPSFIALTGDGTPTIGSFTPASGEVGAVVTITGTNYIDVSKVLFNGVAATSFTADSQTQISATVPIPVGSVTGGITVTTGQGTTTSGAAFTTQGSLANYNSAADVLVTANGFTPSGAVYVSLNYAPLAGTRLTLVNNTGLSFITGTYSNLAQGQEIAITYNGTVYHFVANYYGGTGNDLVLQWADNRAVGWGLNNYSQLGSNNPSNFLFPTAITTSGVLAGKTITQVASGGSHTLALCSDGTIVGWGSNSNGQLGDGSVVNASEPVLVSTTGTALAGKTVTAIAAGQAHSLALCSDGTVAAWGLGLNGQLGNNSTADSHVPVAVSAAGVLSGKTVTALAAGSSHSLARCSDGTVAAWGLNTSGQLGNNSTAQSPVPQAVTSTGTALAGRTVTAVAGGSAHSLALCSDGTVVAWGFNSSSQLGNNSTVQSLVAVAVSTAGVLSGKTVAAIATCQGAAHNLALCTDGTLVAWGANTNGQLGIGSTSNSLVPTAVTATGTALAGKTVAGVFAGSNHSLVLCSDGSAAAFGSNTNGQLGNGGTSQATKAVAVAMGGTILAGRTIAALSGGSLHSIALCSDGTTAAWGCNTEGETGNSTMNAPVPVAVSTAGTPLAGAAILSLSTGACHSLALCSDGTVVAWGYNGMGQLGNGTNTNSLVPVAVTTAGTALAGKTVVAVSAGSNHSLALCSDGTVAAWGLGTNGQLGNNNITSSNVPVAVTTSGTALGGQTVVAMAAGAGNYSMALCADGTVATWGDNSNGQLGNGSTTQSLVPVAVSTAGTALNGQTVIAIAAGQSHSLAVCADGTVAAWGANASGQLGNNTLTSSPVPVAASTAGVLSGRSVVAIAAGSSHTCALCADGTLVAWGANSQGQLGNQSTTDSPEPVAVSTAGVLSGRTVASIAAGPLHNVAACSDGTAVTWGFGGDGELGNNSYDSSTVPVLVSTASLAAGESLAQAVSGAGSSHCLGLVAGPPAAQVLLQQPAGVSLANGSSSVDFGSCVPGATTSRMFTLVNAGTAPLSISGITFDGANSSDFAVTTPPANQVAVGASTTFVVAFTPGAALTRSGTLHLSSNDPANGSFAVAVVGVGDGAFAVACNSAADAPLSVPDFTATGSTISFTLNYVPVTGANLTVISNTGLNFINGTFDNLAQGAAVALLYQGSVYNFVANYYGGTGNDLVLQWAGNRPVAWGLDNYSQLGNNNPTNVLIPTGVTTSGVLAGRTVMQVAAGWSHTLALCSDGSLVAWGMNSSGQLGNNSTTQSTVPVLVTATGVLAGKTVTAIAAGSYHSLVLCSDGTVVAWGQNSFGQLGNNSTTLSTVPVAVTTSGVLAGKTVIAIAAGNLHSLAVCSDGTAVTWGSNSSGQLGNNSTTQNTVPVAVTTAGTALAGKTIRALSGGYGYSLALCSDGTVAAWGSGSLGQLGNNSSTQSNVAVAVSTAGTALSGKTVTAVAAGGLHSLALCSDGTLAAWGYNYYGELGNNSTNSSSVPVAVFASGALTGKTVAGIAAGYFHSLVRCSDGSALAWGSDSNGQLGNNKTTQSTVPVLVTTPGTLLAGKSVSVIVAGQSHSLVLCADGTLAGWGNDINGQLGNNLPLSFLTPVAVITTGTPLEGKTIIAQAAGQYHSLALCSDGTLATWGYNAFGQLGNGSTINNPVATSVIQTGVLNDKTVVAISAGQSHSLALCSDGTVAAWGYNSFGQLGNSSTTQSAIPVAVSTSGVLAGKTVIAISAGQSHSLALCSDGTLAAWGYNTYGQLGNNTTTNSSVPVAVTTAGTPLAGKAVVAMCAGAYHGLALCSDGTLAAWGYNQYGQLGNNATTSSSVPVAVSTIGTVLAGRRVGALAAGNFHSIALCLDGTVAAWGANSSSQLGNNSTATSSVPVAVSISGTALAGQTVSALSAGLVHGLAICADGTVATWGYNADGELGNNSTISSKVPVAVSMTALAAGENCVQAVSGQNASHTLALIAAPPLPQLIVQQPDGTGLHGSSTVDFGSNAVGTGSTQEFILLNQGTASLAISGLTLDGANAADFAITTAPASTIEAGGSSTMVVTFTPGAALARSASLHLISNDPASSPFDLSLTGAGEIALVAAYSSAAAVPLTVATFNATGSTVSFTLNYAPAPGTNFTVVNDTGLGFILGRFTNLAQGQTVALNHGGKTYQFVANYYGGTGNDLVLQWAGNRPLAWGINTYGQLGNKAATSYPAPVPVTSTGVLAGKQVTAIAHGQYHSVALCSDGTVAAWGSNVFGQLGSGSYVNSTVPVAVVTAGTPLAGQTVIAVAAGFSHSLALCADGTVVAWGYNYYGQLGNNSTTSANVPVAVTTSGALAGKTVVGVSAGNYHSLAACADGTVVAWGYNSYGQLGNNSTTQSSVPVAVTSSGVLAGRTVTTVCAGNFHSLAVCSDGTVAAWGYNGFGQLGNNSTTQSTVPVAVTSNGVLAGRTVSAVAAGYYHSLAVCTDGTVAAWGYNASGQLGNNSTLSSNVPVLASDSDTALTGKTATGVSAGQYHSLALCSDGTVVVWGSNVYGQLGNGSYINSPVPVVAAGVLADKTATAVAGGYNHSGAVCSDGTVAEWGSNAYGQLGSGETTLFPVPIPVMTADTPLAGKTLIAHAAGFGHSLGLCSDGTLAAWGSNSYGQLGNNSTTNASIPVAVATSGVLAGKTIIAVSAGNFHSLALCSDGTVAAWGYNTNGQLGNNSTTQSSVPVAVTTSGVLAGKTVVSISAGYYHSLVLCSDGTVAAWGYNTYGQLGNNTTTSSTVPVAVSTRGVLAGKTVIAISAGCYHSLVLCADGTVAAWGYNTNGQLGNNSTTQSAEPVAVTTSGVLAGQTVTGVSAGYGHSLALCSDGTVAAWGYNAFGQLGNTTTSNSSVPVAVTTSGVLAGRTVASIVTGYYHSLALCSDGTLVSWGFNIDGELGNNSSLSSHVPVAVNTSALAPGEQFVQVATAANAYHNLAIVAQPPPSPLIYVQQGINTHLVSGSSLVDFGAGPVGEEVTQTFTVGNSGTADLTLTGVTLDGVNAADFAITTAPAGTVAAGATTTLAVTFTPGGALGRTAVLHLSSNDPYTSPFSITLAGSGAGDLTATYNSATDVPVTTGAFNASGSTMSFALNYAPTPGTTLTVVNNTGLGFISGAFSQLAHGQRVSLSYQGVTYHFVASYYGGTGNDLVLVWADSRPFAWGRNTAGELGNNSTTDSGIPVAVTTAGTPLAGGTLLAFASGYENSLALCSDGSLTTWGYNVYGQLGNSTTTSSSLPVAVTTAGTPLAGKVIAAVSGGYYHSLALCADGTLAAWGYNYYGQLGNNTTTNSSVPVAVTSAGTPLAGKAVVAIGSGLYHNLVLCSDGTLAAWGYNYYGQLGNSTTASSSIPVAVTTAGTPLEGKSVVSMAAGGYHNIALCSDGTLVTWGGNIYGQLGSNSTTNSSVPVAVTTAGTVLAGKTVLALAAGQNHNLALCSDGTLAAWGNNTYGQLGNNSTIQSNVPVAVTTSGVLAGKTIVGVFAGAYHNVVACADGTLAAWGYNGNGQLGNNTTTPSSIPVLVSTSPLAAGEHFTLVSSGQIAYHTLALVAAPMPAAVSTLAATAVTATTAVLNGTVNAAGGTATVSFDYGLTASYSTNVAGTPATVTGGGATAVSTTLTGLTPAATYHFRVNGANGSGISNGTDLSFTTPDDNASLSSLTLSTGTLAPVFGSAVFAYAVAMPNATASFTLTPVTASSSATLTVNGGAAASGVTSAPISFSSDSATVNVVVTAQDGATVKTYALNLSRNTPYLDWAAANNLTGTGTAFAADSDGDGISNLLEYAFNASPATSDNGSILPKGGTSLDPGDGKHYFTYTYRRRILPGTLTYTIEGAMNLGTWSAVQAQNLAQVGTPVPTGDGISEVIQFRILPALEDAPAVKFFRLKVSP